MFLYSLLLLLCLAIFPYLSNGQCSSVLGHNIYLGDCYDVLHRAEAFVAGLSFKEPMFIRQTGGDLQNLPRSFTMPGGTCSMAVDLPGDIFQRKRGSWPFHLEQLKAIVKDCVQEGNGIGGLFIRDGFEYTVVNPEGGSDPNVEVHACMRPADLPQHSVGQCMVIQQR